MRLIFPGGLNENDGTRPEECQEGYNFELVFGDTDFRPRRPQDLKGTSTLAGSISGIMQLILKDNTETTLIFEDDASTPTIYEWDGSTTFTSKRTTNLAVGSRLRDVHYVLDDTLTIVDIEKLTPLMKWDGTSLTRHKTGIYDGNPAAVTSITRSGQVATVTTTSAHGMSTGDLMVIAGADQTEYNIEAEITVTGSTTYTYTVSGSPVTPATGTITFDVGTEIFAKYAVVHNGRMWLFNVKAGASDNPHLMVASQFENIEVFNSSTRVGDSGFTTGLEAFYMLTKDLKPINGVTVFHQQLIISTVDGRMYRLTGNDSTNYDWVDYYGGSAAVGNESIINFGNDVAFMRKGGHIDTLIATNTSGDVDVDNISRWITDTVKDLSGALTVYDQTYQKVYFFVTDKVLVLFKDVLYGYGRELSPWSVYTTNLTNSFNAVSAKYLRRPGESTYSVYWGDDSGHIYDMNGSSTGDAGSTSIPSYRKTNIIENPEVTNGVIFGKVQYRRKGDVDLTISLDWSGAYNTTESTINLEGPPAGDVGAYFGADIYFGGDVYFNQGFQFIDLVSKKNFSPSGRENSFSLGVSADTTVRFKVDNIDIGGI